MNQQQRYKVMLDAGHGGNDPGATGGGLREKDINLYVSLKVRDILEKAGVTVFMSRTTDRTLSLPARTKEANQKKANILLSIHVNAAANTSAKGYETFHYPGSSKGKALATAVHKEVIDAKIYNSNRGVKSANFHMLRESNMPAVLVEFAFISNAQDRVLLTNKKDEFAEALAKGVLNYLGVKPSEVTPTVTDINIMGRPIATVEQMVSYVKKNNPNPKLSVTLEELAKLFIEEGNIEGVRGDIAFAQAIKETGFFKYGGDVLPEQNNYAGIGTVGGGVKGAYFDTAKIGVQAQIQHLQAYATKDKLNQELVDPRYHLVTRGSAPTVTGLNGKWAVPGKNYGEDILDILDRILKEPKGDTQDMAKDYENHWAKESIDKVIELGLMQGFDDGNFYPSKELTRAEFATALVRLIEQANLDVKKK